MTVVTTPAILIESDGTPWGTRVVTGGGIDLSEYVERIEWEIRGGELPIARLHVAIVGGKVPVELANVVLHVRDIYPRWRRWLFRLQRWFR